MIRFREIWRDLVPGWLRRGDGELIQTVEGAVIDSFAERCRQTPWLMFPSLAPPDALTYIGSDRALPRGFEEPEASYRQRLIAWRFPRGHRVRGNAVALLEQIALALPQTLDVQTIDARGTRYDFDPADATTTVTRGVAWDWDAIPLTPLWARFWVVLETTATPPGVWGDAGDEEFWGDGADETWASPDIKPGEIEAVRTLVAPQSLSWVPAGRRPVVLTIWYAGQSFPAPTGDWDEWTNRDDAYAYVSLNRAEH